MATSPILSRLRARQGNPFYPGEEPDIGSSWWWSPAGLAVRYAIVAAVIGLILLYFIGGYMHARRRQRKGLEPLRYHRWMLRSNIYQTQQPPSMPRPVYAYYGDPRAPAYQMEGMYPPPPPAYHNAEAPPPTYAPPPGASKILADQNVREVNPAEGEGSAGARAGPA